MKQETIGWLIDSDPSVAFQTKRDLLALAKSEWKLDQQEMKTKGWCKQLLDLQANDGRWGDGYYGPKFISTHYTLLLLKRLEMLVTPQIVRGCQQLININAIGKILETDPSRIDACITGMGLGILAHFQQQDQLYDTILEYLIDNQLPDGGWNCRYGRQLKKGVNHSSMNTTLSVLEGLQELVAFKSDLKEQIEQLRDRAHEFLLIHRLYKSHTTGKSINKSFHDISFPPRWKYNILSALDYFRNIKQPYDERMQDALDIIVATGNNERWPQGTQMTGKIFFSVNIARQGNPFNTLRALRVLGRYLPEVLE